MNTYHTPRGAGEKKTEVVGGIGVSTLFSGRHTFAGVDTAKAHASVVGCVSRQPSYPAKVIELPFENYWIAAVAFSLYVYRMQR